MVGNLFKLFCLRNFIECVWFTEWLPVTVNKPGATSKHNWKVRGEHAFLITLNRLYKGYDLNADSFWRYGYSAMGAIYNAMLEWIDTAHSARLRRLPEVLVRAPEFNTWSCT